MQEVTSEDGGLTCIVQDNSGTKNYYASPCPPTSESEMEMLVLDLNSGGNVYSAGTNTLYSNAGQSDGFLNHHCAVMHPANLTVLDEPADMPVMPCASINWTSADGIEPGIR